MLGINVSSATLRNEMSSLEQDGFLIKPHTSAGRIPSSTGYRYYVNNIMGENDITSGEKQFILNRLYKVLDDPESILKETSHIISLMTNFLAISTTPPPTGAKIKRIYIVQISSQSAMLIIITSNGMVKNRLFKCDYILTNHVVKIFEKISNEKFVDLDISSVTPAFIQSCAVEFGEFALLMANVLTAISQSCLQASLLNFTVSGKTNLIFSSEFQMDDIKNCMMILNDNKEIEDLLLYKEYENSVLIGKEIKINELENFSIISKRYNISNEKAGAIAIIGPIRIDYKRNTALLNFICTTIENLISELLEI